MKSLPKENDTHLLLCIIICLGLFLRIWGISFGLPDTFHADEPIVVNHALAYASLDFNPHFFRIPPLVSYGLFLLYGLLFLLGKLAGFFTTTAAFEHFFYTNPTFFYLTGRLCFGALLGTATIFFIYLFSRNHFNNKTALIASFFLSTCFLHIKDSHYLYTDIPLIFCMVAAWCFIAKTPNNALIAGFWIGLCTAVKYNGIFVSIPYFVWLCYHEPYWKMRLKKILLSSLSALIAFILLNPFALLDYSFFIKELIAESAAHTSAGEPFHHIVYSLKNGLGLPLGLLSLAGIIYGFFRNNPISKSLSIFCICYYLILVKAGQSYDRYVLPLLPPMLVLAANLLTQILQYTSTRIVIWVVLVIAYPSLWKSIQFDSLMTAQDTRTLAKSWIENHLPVDSRIALDGDFFMPRLLFSEKSLRQKENELLVQSPTSPKLRKLHYLITQSIKPNYKGYDLFFLTTETKEQNRFLFGKPILPYDIMILREKKIRYVIISDYQPRTRQTDFYESLREQGALLAEFSPYKDGKIRKTYDRIAMTGGPSTDQEIYSRDRNGHSIQIYALKPTRIVNSKPAAF